MFFLGLGLGLRLFFVDLWICTRRSTGEAIQKNFRAIVWFAVENRFFIISITIYLFIFYLYSTCT